MPARAGAVKPWHAPVVTSPTSPPPALRLAQRARAALAAGRTKDAAWLALYALEHDERCGLAWSVIARILVEVARDPLGTLAAGHALELGVPEEERSGLERHHRIDLWTRGLIRAVSGASLMRASEFDDPSSFTAAPERAAWFDERAGELGGLSRALRAARRMVAAFADAWLVPAEGPTPGDAEDNPLRSDAPWPESAAYLAWRRSVALDDAEEEGASLRAGAAAPAANSGANGHHHGANGSSGAALGPDVMVLSDHWIEREILAYLLEGDTQQAGARARMWAQLRPDKLGPKTALLRVHAAEGHVEERDAIADELTALSEGVSDLNELEEVRVALGELELWEAQLHLLERMEQLAPGHPAILANRGVAMIELGDHEAGARELERALERDPEHGPALANLGLERMRADNYVAARSLLERAVQVAPDQPMAWLYLAACKNNQGDRGGAIADLEQVLRLDPENKQADELLRGLRAWLTEKN